jgi:hypothetical protein
LRRLVALIVHYRDNGRNSRWFWDFRRARFCAALDAGFGRITGIGLRQLRRYGLGRQLRRIR